jgi:hypothetical protein
MAVCICLGAAVMIATAPSAETKTIVMVKMVSNRFDCFRILVGNHLWQRKNS